MPNLGNKGGAAKFAALLDKCVFSTLIVLSAAAFHIAGGYSDGSVSGGSVFPRLASGVVIAMALITLVRPGPSRSSTSSQGDSRSAVYVALLTLVFLVGLPVIGYPILAPLWMGATMWVFGLRAVPTLLAVALGISGIAWFLLARLAFAPPPAGLLEPLF